MYKGNNNNTRTCKCKKKCILFPINGFSSLEFYVCRFISVLFIFVMLHVFQTHLKRLDCWASMPSSGWKWNDKLNKFTWSIRHAERAVAVFKTYFTYCNIRFFFSGTKEKSLTNLPVVYFDWWTDKFISN